LVAMLCFLHLFGGMPKTTAQLTDLLVMYIYAS